MPSFFVPPFTPGDPAGLDRYEEVLAAAHETNPHARIGPRRIFRLECEYRSEAFVVEVGQPERAVNEPVEVILDTLEDELRARGSLEGPRPEPREFAELLISELIRFPPAVPA